MTHPTILAMLADDRHAELLREADTHRRAAALRGSAGRRPRSGLVARLQRLAPWASDRRAPVQICCA